MAVKEIIAAYFFIVLFCFSKKEPKKEPDKGLHPLCRKQLCSALVLLWLLHLIATLRRIQHNLINAVIDLMSCHSQILLNKKYFSTTQTTPQSFHPPHLQVPCKYIHLFGHCIYNPAARF